MHDDTIRSKPNMCDSCDFETKHLESYLKVTHKGNPVKWLCDLCASTPTGTAFEYDSNKHTHDILATLCYIGNTILKEIKENSINY